MRGKGDGSVVDGLIILARFLQLAALCFLAGGALLRLVVAPSRLARACEIAVAAVALASALTWLAGVAAEMAGGFSELLAPDTLAAVLLETRFGRLWSVRLALLAAMLALTCAPRTRRTDVIMLALAGAAIAALAGVGHGTAGAGPVGALHVLADVVHLLCAAAWLGGLAALAVLMGLAFHADEKEAAVAAVRRALPRFSRLGYIAVAALLLTGCINTVILVPRPEQLLTSDYGRVLLVKLGLVALMVAFALLNHFVLAPRVLGVRAGDDGARNMRALWHSVAVEQATGLAVLAVVAVLGTIHPVP
jgi:putative copper resistance protein D